MRNLKRALSLALAAVMVIGMMVTGAGAAFSDQESIKNTEAVDVVNILGIIDGLPGGSYGPEQLVDRASMTKMITLALSGGAAPVLGTKVTPTYSDIKGTWAESFIEYCSSLKIIAGDGTGKFNPTGSVTGSQAAKMLMVALGYDATISGFTGASWEINVNREASTAGLYTGLSGLQASAPLSRDNAAQMIYNALNAKMMEKKPSIDITTGGISFTYEKSNKTMLEDKFGVVKVEGVVTGNEFVDGTGMKGKTAMTVSNYDAKGEQDIFDNGQTFNIATGADELGKSVTLFVKPAGTSALANKATVIGTAIINGNNKILATGKATVNDSNESNDLTKLLKAEGLKLDGSDVTKYLNYTGSTVENATAAKVLNTKGVEAQYIDNDADGVVEVVTFLAKSFGKVGTVSTAKDGSLSISNVGSFNPNGTAGFTGLNTSDATNKVANFADLGVAKDDYAFYYQVNGDLYYVEKAETITVDVTSTKGNTIYAGTTSYTSSGLNTKDLAAADEVQGTLSQAVTVGKSAVLYLDSTGYVVYVTDTESTSNYLMVTATSTSGYGDTLGARVVFQDGTTGTINVTQVTKTDSTTPIKVSNDATGAENYLKAHAMTKGAAGLIFSYTKSDDDYTLKAIGGSYQDRINVKNNNPTINSTLFANTATKFVVENGGDYAGYVGISKVPSHDGAFIYAIKNANNMASVIFTAGGVGARSENNYMYVLSKNPNVSGTSSKLVYTYDVIRNGEITTIEGTGTGIFANAGLNVVTFTGSKASGGDTTSVDPADAKVMKPASAATAASNGVIANGSGSFFYNDNTKFFLITGDNAEKDVTLVSADSIVTEGAGQDIVSIQTDSTSNSTARYVFIERG